MSMYKLRKRRKQHFCQRVQKYWSILLRSPLSHDPVMWLPVRNKERAKNTPSSPSSKTHLAAPLTFVPEWCSCDAYAPPTETTLAQRQDRTSGGGGGGRSIYTSHRGTKQIENKQNAEKQRKQTNKEVTSDSSGRAAWGGWQALANV